MAVVVVVVVVVAAVASIRCWGANRMWMPATKRTRVFSFSRELDRAYVFLHMHIYIFIYLFIFSKMQHNTFLQCCPQRCHA